MHIYNTKPFNLASNLISMSYKYQNLFFLNRFHVVFMGQDKNVQL